MESEANPGRAFAVKVTQFEPAKAMTWSGGMPFGLFKGVRTFTLTPADDGATRFDMREEYSGPMLGLIWRSMPDLQPSFDQFAQGLKTRVERRVVDLATGSVSGERASSPPTLLLQPAGSWWDEY